MDNYPGFDEGISGAELARRLTNQARRFGVEIVQACAVESLSQNGQYLTVRTGRGNVPACTMRHSVVRDTPIISRTCRGLMNCTVHLHFVAARPTR